MYRFLAILLFINATAHGQSSIDKFELNRGAIIYTRTFPSTLSLAELQSRIAEVGIIDNVQFLDSVIIGRIPKLVIESKRAGYSWAKTPVYLYQNFIRAHVVIKQRPQHFEVTVRSIMVIESSKVNAGIFSHDAGDEMPLEFYATNNSKERFTKSFVNDGSKIIDFTLTDRLSFLGN